MYKYGVRKGELLERTTGAKRLAFARCTLPHVLCPWLRLVLSFVLAVGVLGLLLSLLAGPARIVHALTGTVPTHGAQEAAQAEAKDFAPGGQVERAAADPPPPAYLVLDAPRPPLISELQFKPAPQELHVCSSGCPYTTVQGAVNAARAGDVILVAEGTYGDHDGDGSVVEIAKTVTLRGGYTTADWAIPDPAAHPSVLDGQNTARVILISGDVAPTIEGFVVRNGATEIGGSGAGVYVASGDPTLSRCRIENNTASFSGGAVYVASGTPLIENCLLVGNHAAQKRGGGVYVAGGFPTIHYSVFYQNAALQQGGGIYIADGAATVAGVIFAANTAADGGGVYVADGSPFFGYNGYWSNSPTHAAGSLSLGASDLVDVDPLFIAPGGGDFRLGADSLYIDAGDPGSYPAADYAGTGRYLGAGPDIGAYERYEGTCFARAGERPIRGSVSAALADATAGDIVKVAGVCTGTGESVVTLSMAVTLRGGYTLTNWTDPDPDRYLSVIDGEGARRGISIGAVPATVEGLYIRNGYHDVRGGGIYIGVGSAATVRDNEIAFNGLLPPDAVAGGGVFVAQGDGVVIQNNDIHHNEIFVAPTHSSNGGAGIFVFSGSPLIEGNEIHDNTVHGFGGGGIYVYGGGSTIRRNHIYNNTQLEGNNGGAGVYVFGGTAVVERNNIHDNDTASTFAPSGGGGIYVHQASSTIRNNLIYNNTAGGSGSGGGLFVYSAVPTINGNTFYRNSAATGGAAFLNGTATVVRNSIVATNTAGVASGVYGSCDHCVIWGNTNANGSDTNSQLADPQFVDPDGGDFHLWSSSPARDNAGPSYPPEDYDGYARPFGPAADIGAFEYYAGLCFARVGSGAIYPTVQQAIDAAPAGETIRVAGHCTASGGPLASIVQGLTLEGGYTLTNWIARTTQTVLDGGGAQQVIVIDTPDPILLDGFIVRGGQAADGAALQVLNTGDIDVWNVVLAANTATGVDGAIVALAGGSADLYNNTFVYNDAAAAVKVAGAAVVSNTILVSNTNNTVSGATCAFCLVGIDPMFVDPAAGDFHLQPASPAIFGGDPNTDLDHDWEGDSRPLGTGYDIGADECASFPGLAFAPSGLISLDGAPGRATIHTHYLTNTGGIADTYELSHAIVYSGGSGWAVTYDHFVTLDRAEAAPVPVAVQVPPDAISGSVATVYVTATSGLNPFMSRLVTNTTYINWRPGVTLTPVYSAFLNPGQVITYLHTLRNLGNAPDSFTLTLSSLPGGWAGITPTTVSNLAPGASANIWMSVTVPRTMPGGVTETVAIEGVNWDLDVRAAITDRFQVNHVTGDRFVAGSGSDHLNNCLVMSEPCRSVGYAAGQAAAGDTVRVAGGAYAEHDILLNKTITIAGGWSTRPQDESWWGARVLRPDPERNPTVVDAQGRGRVLEIVGDPRVEGLTLRGGATPGSGGAVFIASGAPLLRNNRILHNQAEAYGGGVYNWMGTPTIERCSIGYNTAPRGAGFATNSGAPRFWNNVVFKNTTSGTDGDGGGIYVLGGAPLIWHDTLYGNTANRGGGIFVSAGSAAISNTIVVSNAAATAGGVYNLPSATLLGYNDVWGNVNGDYVGASAGLGSVAVAPGFLAPAADDYHLAPNSPVADIAAPSMLAADLDGEPRVVGAGPDIGADEFAWGVIHFTPSYSGMVESCASIAYTHWVSHTGRYTDTILFSPQSDRGLIVTVDPPQVTLGYRVSVPVTVEVTVPWCTSIGPVKDTTLVTAYSRDQSFIRTTVTDTNYIDVEPALRFTPDRTLYTPPGTVYYTHTLTNLGNFTDTITYTVGGDFGWQIAVLEPIIVLGRGQSRVVTVALTIPDTTVSGTVHTMHITANSVYSWMVNGVPVSAGVVDTTTVAPKPGVDVQTVPLFEPGLCIDPQSPRPDGNIGTYPYLVWNNGNLTDTIALAAYTGIDRGFPITVSDSPFFFAPGVAAPVVFTPTTMLPFFVHVDVPPTTPYGIEDRVYLSATSQFDPSVWDVASYNLLTIQIDVDIDDPVTQTLFLEPETSYQHTFTYSETFVGPEENRVSLSICDWGPPLPARWTPPSGEPVDIVEGEIGVVPVTIGVPMDVYTAVAEICLELETLEHCDARDFVIDTIIVNRPHGELTPDRLNEQAIPGTVVTYTFSLSNTSSFDDQYALSWLFTRPAAYPGWAASVSPAIAVLDAGHGLTVTAVMTVPPGVQMDEQAHLVITATSSYTDAIFDTATTRWTVPSLPMAEIVPDHEGAAYPGTWISYTHVLRNVGNRSGLFRLTTSSSLGFATVEPGLVELSPLASYSPVVVWVFIPTWAEVGAIDDTQVIVTFDKDREGREQMQVVAHDLTTIRPIPGTRYVRPDGIDEGNNCTDPSYAPCATIQHAVAQAAPGDEIRIAGGYYTDLHGFVDAGETVTQVVFLDKSVILRGGYSGPDWDFSDPVRNPSILDAQRAGRVIYVVEDVTPTIAALNLTGGFVQNGHGAGLYIASGTVPTVERNVIEGNDAAGIGAQGGGLYYAGPGGLVLHQNTLRDNTAEDGSGAYLIGIDASVWNNVFDTNTASGLGGGLYVLGGSPAVWNNTFYGNSADRGGGLYYLGTGAPSISNTILAWNEATVAGGGGGVFAAGGAPLLDYNNYWLNAGGDAPGMVTGTHSLAADPGFVDPGAGDLHLRVSSPCVDRADPHTQVDRDRDDKPRPLLDGYDIGAYEYGLLFTKHAPIYVVAGETIEYRIVITNTGTMTQYNVLVTDTLDPALEFVGPLVPPSGEYLAASRTVSWTVAVPGMGAIELSFVAQVADDLASGALVTDVAWIDSRPSNMVTSEHRTCWVRLNDDPTDYTTVQAAVDASTGPDDVVKVAGTCVDVNGYGGLRQVVYLNKTLTLRGGYTSANWTAPDPAANPTRLDALGLGRVLYITGGVQPAIEGLILNGGDAAGLGGLAGSDAGGGVYVIAATVGLSGSIVSGSEGTLGGGLCLVSARAYLTNSVVSDNQAVSGGGLYLAAGTADLLHTTLARNGGGGAFLAGYDLVGSAGAMTNVIMADQSPDLAVDAASVAAVDGVLWWPEGEWVGAGTTTVANEYTGDPRFAADGYHLSAGSAAVDRGADTGLNADIDGDPRPWNDLPDLGADELMLRMEVLKVASPDPVRPGAALDYTIYVTNTGGVALNLTITDTLPAQVAVDPAQALVWSALVEPGAAWTQAVPVTAGLGYSGTLVNQVDVSAVEGLTATYVLTTYAVGTPQVDVSKTVTPAGVQAGEVVTYTIRVANTGDVDLLPTVVDTPPVQVIPNDEVTWIPPLLAPGETWTATLTATTPFGYAGPLSNLVRVTTAEGVTDTDTVLSMVGVTPAVTVTKSAYPSPVLAGDPLTYTISVTNTGNTVLDATVADLLPAQVTEPGTQVWHVRLDEANRTWSTTVVVTPNLGYLGTLTNVVTVDTLEGARAAYTLTTESQAALQVRISKAAAPDPAAAAGLLTYTISVTNTGNMPLTAWITDHLPANTTHVTATDVLTWEHELLAPNEVWTATVTVLVDWGYDGQLVNRVEVDTLEGVRDEYTLTTDVQVALGVEVLKFAHPSPVLAGDPLTYTILVTNTGGGPLDAVVTDLLPDHVTPGGTEMWNVALDEANRTWSTTLVVTPELAYAGLLTNVVQVNTAQGVSDSYTLTTPSLIVPGVAVSKHADPFWVEPGGALMYTIHVTNTGNVTLTAWITDWLPAQVSPSGEQNWALELPPRQAQTINVPVTSIEGYIGPLVNVVRVDTAQGVWAVYTETSQACTPLATLELAGPARGDPGADLVFTATLTPPTTTMPLTYTWEADGQPTLVHVGEATSDTVTLNWASPGTYAMTLTVVNGCGSTLQRTQLVAVGFCPTGVTRVTIVGITHGAADTPYTLSALVEPADATPPVTYLWSPEPVSGQGTANATYSWSTLGEQTVSVQVTNCGGAASDEHTISIQEGGIVYLPLFLGNYRRAPDLEVVDIQTAWGVGAAPDEVIVTLRNNGPAPVVSDFWVDLYLDPSRVPSTGEVWNDLSSQGKAWLVYAPNLQPGGVLVLRTSDPDDPNNPDDRYSNWPDKLPTGAHWLYAQADSYWRPVGMILELDETNNVLGLAYTRAANGGAAPLPTPPPERPLDATPEPALPPEPRPTPGPRSTPTPLP